MPALYSLAVPAACCRRTSGSSAPRAREETDEQFRERMKQAVKEHARDPFDEEVWERARRRDALHRRSTSPTRSGEDDLRDTLTKLDEERGTLGNRVYYFAVPPSAIGTLVHEIAAAASAPRAGSG